MDLNKILSEAVAKIEEEKTIETLIEQKLNKCIDEIIADQFRYSGTIKKQIEKHFQENMSINLDGVTMSEYNEYITRSVKSKLDYALNEQAAKAATEMIADILKTNSIKTKEYSIDSFLEKLLSYEDIDLDDCEKEYDDGPTAYKTCSLHIEKSDSLTFLYFDPSEDKATYKCKYRLVINKHGVIEGANATITGTFLDNANGFLIACKYEGVTIRNLSNESDENYSVNVTDNFDAHDIMCGC